MRACDAGEHEADKDEDEREEEEEGALACTPSCGKQAVGEVVRVCAANIEGAARGEDTNGEDGVVIAGDC
jgi:hypothetical protein